MRSNRLTGTYLLGIEPMFVFDYEGDLVIAFTGVPREFAARLVAEGNAFRWEGGQLDGSLVTFEEGDPSPGGALGGVLDFKRAPDELPVPGGRGLRLPEFDPSPDEETAYRRILGSIVDDPDGGLVEWNLPWPKWRFVEWLRREDSAIFHGSPKPDINLFTPIRNSVEIMDQGGSGNLAAVYGTPFGLWAMWFAVLDRSKLKGSIRNGVMRWADRSGRAIDLYQFSVHHDLVGTDIWRRGTLYLLPRTPFRANPYFPGGPDANEWASPTEVRPMKRIAVDPGDFPFLDQVGGHDDSELIQAEELGDVVMRKVSSARRLAGGMEIDLTWDDELAKVMDEYLATRRRLTPDVARRLTQSEGGRATLEVRGPEGFLQAYERSLREAGIVVES